MAGKGTHKNTLENKRDHGAERKYLGTGAQREFSGVTWAGASHTLRHREPGTQKGLVSDAPRQASWVPTPALCPCSVTSTVGVGRLTPLLTQVSKQLQSLSANRPLRPPGMPAFPGHAGAWGASARTLTSVGIDPR